MNKTKAGLVSVLCAIGLFYLTCSAFGQQVERGDWHIEMKCKHAVAGDFIIFYVPTLELAQSYRKAGIVGKDIEHKFLQDYKIAKELLDEQMKEAGLTCKDPVLKDKNAKSRLELMAKMYTVVGQEYMAQYRYWMVVLSLEQDPFR